MHVHAPYVLHMPLLLWCLTQLAGWDAIATVVAENIRKAWEMKDTLCAGIVARKCALRWKSQNLFLSYRQRGGGLLVVPVTSVRMTSSCIIFSAITTRHV